MTEPYTQILHLIEIQHFASHYSTKPCFSNNDEIDYSQSLKIFGSNILHICKTLNTRMIVIDKIIPSPGEPIK